MQKKISMFSIWNSIILKTFMWNKIKYFFDIKNGVNKSLIIPVKEIWN